MGLIGKTNEERIWNYLKSKGLNNYGCASMMGNLFAESGLKPNNLQNTGNAKLNMTDDEYIVAVDSGTYTKDQFIKDKFGIGICQWAYWSRKNGLYEYAISTNRSIGDLEMQLEYLYKELSESYKIVLSVLISATSIEQASDIVLVKFENPANQNDAVKEKRREYSKNYYEKFCEKSIQQEVVNMGIKANSLLEIFQKMYAERWPYVWGAARKGCVDCSGAFVYAYKQFGKSIYHGSNRIARKYVGTLQSIDKARPCWAAFKWKRDGAPSEYTDGKGNFYHIGLVDDTGLKVLNAKGTNSGFCLDPIDTWDYVAMLNDVDYSNMVVGSQVDRQTLFKAIVITSGGVLNLRKNPNGTIIGRIPNGTCLDVVDDSNSNWWMVEYNNLVGYVSTVYMKREGNNTIVESINYKIGEKVKLIAGATYASGESIRSWVFDKVLYVREIQGDNIVISTLKIGAITGVVPSRFLVKISEGNASFIPYNVRVIVDSLNIRHGAGTNYSKIGVITDSGVYTIVEEADGVGAFKWGKLQIGEQWISLDYTEKI